LLPQLHEVRRGEDVLRDPKQEERERLSVRKLPGIKHRMRYSNAN
jgi:hypothetical protein